ncbi:MAG: hypothetical protein ABIK37_00770 [candidate division WOR-3 bacterium]
MESAKAECCPKCHGTRMTNLVYVRTGQETCVYVKCADCGSYVARYVLARYTSDRCYESLLAGLRGFAHRSGKRCLEQIEEFGAMVAAEFERVQKLALENPHEQRVEEMICEAEKDRPNRDS